MVMTQITHLYKVIEPTLALKKLSGEFTFIGMSKSVLRMRGSLFWVNNNDTQMPPSFILENRGNRLKCRKRL